MVHLIYEGLLIKRNSPGYEPPWAGKIDRWYQLDENCFFFCEALHQWNYLIDYAQPDIVFLAQYGASNIADFDFVKTQSSSPSKFVFTLPNISISVIFQLLKFNGKIYCLSKGEETASFARNEAASYAKSGKKVWLFSVPKCESLEKKKIEFFEFSP
jgi:hypothetical protein